VIRYDDWQARLGAHIKAALQRPFSWGEFDCCTFACDGILAMTGVDPMVDLRGKYGTPIEAARALKVFSGAGLEQAAARIADILSSPETAPMLARRGDCIFARTSHGPALGLVSLNGREGLFAGASGLTAIPLRNCLRAWSV
jgi:hypothetical protein